MNRIKLYLFSQKTKLCEKRFSLLYHLGDILYLALFVMYGIIKTTEDYECVVCSIVD